MRSRIAILAALLLAACNQNVGSLLAEKPEPKPMPMPMPGPCEMDELPPPLVCGDGACRVEVPACVGTTENVCRPLLPSAEICNDIDDDCDGEIDNGCDDDLDGYCDQGMAVVGNPVVCKANLPDCDDQNEAIHPGRTEICDDDVDNDCNGFADYLDVEGCVHVTASIDDPDGTIFITHGTTRVVTAQVNPPTMELAREWRVIGAAPDDTCRTDQVEITNPVDTDGQSRRTIRIEDSPELIPCAWTLSLTVGEVASDSVVLRMSNPRPRVDDMVGAVLDGGTLEVSVAAGTTPTLTAVEPADDDQPVTIEWRGADVGLLDCQSPCVGAAMTFAQPPAPGTYNFVLRANDAFEARRVRTRNVRVVVRNCAWLVSPTTTNPPPGAYTSLQAAIDDAEMRGADVCIAGSDDLDVTAPVVLPNGVGINGAFALDRQPTDTRNHLRLTSAASIGFASGYSGTLRGLIVEGAAGRTLVEAVDAEPRFAGVEIVVPGGNGGRGLRIESTIGSSTVRLVSSELTSSGAPVDATSILVVGAQAGTASLVMVGGSTVELTNCRGTCRGVSVRGRANASITGGTVNVEAFTPGARAWAIDIRSLANARPTASIIDLDQIVARTREGNPGDETIAIRLFETNRVEISDNVLVGGTSHVAGRRLSAGIADGAVRRDGSIVAGNSVGLVIDNNRQIAAGRASYAWNRATCNDEPVLREGADVAAGILLVGTATAAITRSGNNNSRNNGIYGGASAAQWEPSTRVLPPAVPGIWTIDTRNVRIARNEVRPGVLAALDGCGPQVRPHVEAVRDGLGPEVQASAPSRGLRLEANGLATGRRGSFDPVPGPNEVQTRVVMLSGPGRAVLVNNYVAATRGADLVGVALYGVRDVAMWNNVVEVEALGARGRTVDKRGLLLDEVEDGALTLVNNIVLVREDGADTADPTAIVERSGGAMRAIGRLDHNLLFVESAARGRGGTYVRIEDGPRYTRQEFPVYEARVGGRSNLILPPLFRSFGVEHRRSITRLSAESPARDAGLAEGAPMADRFDNARPSGAGVDIGHHELQ